MAIGSDIGSALGSGQSGYIVHEVLLRGPATLIESYCQRDLDCLCTIAVPPGSAFSGGVATSGGSVGGECVTSWTYSGSSEDCTYDPFTVPIWYLELLLEHCAPPPFGVPFTNCEVALQCFIDNGPPPDDSTGPCAIYYSEWVYVLQRWWINGPGLTALKCMGFELDSPTPEEDGNTVIRWKKYRLYGFRKIGQRCRTVAANNEDCECPSSP